jgi:plastocyanin
MRPGRRSRGARRGGAGVLLAAIVVAVALAAAGCTPRHEPAAREVHIRAFQFVPAADTVQAGDTIVWTNDDIVPHSATDLGKTFDSAEIEAGGAWRWVARSPGTFAYECTLHPTMRGTLVVR